MAETQATEKKEKKGFFKEFKEFITRGNVLDLAVGIIIGGAFTAIVNALCNNILKPIINWIIAVMIGADSLNEMYTFLKTAYMTDESGAQVIDLANSIYIDWGTCINAVINFLLTALVLFLIIKAVMRVSKMRAEARKAIEEAAEKIKAAKTIVISEKDQKSDTAENDEKTVGNDGDAPPETK